jgi:hypothetical protein
MFAVFAVAMAIFCGGATVWFGSTSLTALGVSVFGLAPLLPGLRLSDVADSMNLPTPEMPDTHRGVHLEKEDNQ